VVLIKYKADRVVLASVDGKGPIQVGEFEERQRLKQVEDKVLDVVMVLDSTLDTVSSLLEKYTELRRQNDAPFEDPSSSTQDSIVFALQEKRREVLLIRKKIDALHAKVQGTMQLV
jgi:hypothetical protein